jgi:hypothetical protein
MAISIKTLSIKGLFVTLSTKGTQHNGTLVMPSVGICLMSFVMLRVVMLSDVMLSFVMLGVVMLNVVAPIKHMT